MSKTSVSKPLTERRRAETGERTHAKDHLRDGLESRQGTKEPTSTPVVIEARRGATRGMRLHLQHAQREAVHRGDDACAEAAERSERDEVALPPPRWREGHEAMRRALDEEGETEKQQVKVHLAREMSKRRPRL